MNRTMLLLLFLAANASAAGFDCKKAALPIELAICNNPDLSRADERLTAAYRRLKDSCKNDAGVREGQRAWLAELKHGFDPGRPLALLDKYKDRTAQLEALASRCRPDDFRRPVIETIGDAKQNYTVPFVVTAAPDAGKRINDQIFQRFFNAPAPLKFSAGMAGLPEEFRKGDDRSLVSVEYSVLRNDGRMLIFEFQYEGCGAYCSNSTEQYLFDAHIGEQVQPDDLFTDEGAVAVAAQLKAARVKRGNAIVAQGIKDEKIEDDELETYSRCLREWSRDKPRLSQLEILPDGRWSFVSGTCSAHVNRVHDSLDNLSDTWTAARLKPYLNAYGRSLLLGEGDVRSPVPETLACHDRARLPSLPRHVPGTGIASVVQGPSTRDSFHILLQENGKLWGWGVAFDGELVTDLVSAHTDVPIPIAGDFVKIAAGQSFSGAIARDGSLWTWGSNYAGRLGNGQKSQRSGPSRLGGGFADLALSSSSGLALKSDHTMWTWGGEQIGKERGDREIYRLTPKQIASGVTQIGYGPGGEVLALKQDGSIWSWNREQGAAPDKAGQPHQVGSGFSRLAAHGGDLAFKADGSLWAWGETLTSLTRQTGPVEIGRDFVRVTAGDGNLVLALKADGSLWAPRQRGNKMRFEPITCGIADMAVLGSSWEPLNVLALRRDGTLVAWGNWTLDRQWNVFENTFQNVPRTLGTGFTRLFQTGNVHGNLGGGAVAIKADGNLWEWVKPEAAHPRVEDLLQKVPFAAGSIFAPREP